MASRYTLTNPGHAKDGLFDETLLKGSNASFVVSSVVGHCTAPALYYQPSLASRANSTIPPIQRIMPADPKPEPNDGLPIRSFASAQEFESFLEQNHTTLPGIHLKLAKKSSGIESIASSEAVELALCFGWIDGRVNRVDDKFWLVRFTPRRAKSIWSRKNVETITRLTEDGRMRKSGLEAVEAAKKDGRWDRAYAGPATIQVPDDLVERLSAVPAAKSFFEGLNKRNRYTVLWSIETASPQNRKKRVDALVQMLATGNLPGTSAKVIVESKKKTTKQKKKRTV